VKYTSKPTSLIMCQLISCWRSTIINQLDQLPMCEHSLGACFLFGRWHHRQFSVEKSAGGQHCSWVHMQRATNCLQCLNHSLPPPPPPLSSVGCTRATETCLPQGALDSHTSEEKELENQHQMKRQVAPYQYYLLPLFCPWGE
jgi:hypothetical protein